MLNNLKFPYSILRYKFHKLNKEKKSKEITPREYIKFLNKIRLDGYCVIENFYSKEKCKKIINQIDDKLNNETFKIVSDNTNSDQRLFFSEKVSDEINNFFKNNFLKEMGELSTRMKLKAGFTLANKVTYKKENLGSGGGWHKDAYYPQFKSILYLNDVKISGGPFQLVKKSNKLMTSLGISLKFKKGYPDTRFSNAEIKNLDKEKIKTLTGLAGTLIMFDGSLIHRGSPIKEGFRYALTNYYFPINSYKSQIEKFKKVENE